jgi:hypothetical protein
VDVAVRRRFAFVKLWPQLLVVTEHDGPLMRHTFKELLEIFVNHARRRISPGFRALLLPGGIGVLRLIDLCLTLLERVRQVTPKEPGRRRLQSWQQGLLKQEVFLSGVQAIEWTIEGNGLAGLSHFQGLPWIMSIGGVLGSVGGDDLRAYH